MDLHAKIVFFCGLKNRKLAILSTKNGFTQYCPNLIVLILKIQFLSELVFVAVIIIRG